MSSCFQDINLSNFYGTFKLVLRDSKTLEVQTSTSKRCLFNTQDMMGNLASTALTFTLIGCPLSQVPPLHSRLWCQFVLQTGPWRWWRRQPPPGLHCSLKEPLYWIPPVDPNRQMEPESCLSSGQTHVGPGPWYESKKCVNVKMWYSLVSEHF